MADDPQRDLQLVGDDVHVPLVTGEHARYVNLDYAASAPALEVVKDAVDAFLPWYSSVHRGTGFKSMLSTAAYEGAREAVRSFLSCRPEDTVVFTRNTTDAMNLLMSALPEGTEVIAFETEHHANILPWQRRQCRLLAAPSSPAEAMELLEAALDTPSPGPRLVAVTGASNVTGEVWPVGQIARLAHDHGARTVLDAAQLAPHRSIDMATLDVDYLALSGHKLYAPFGAGVLVGRPDWLREGEPFLAGGGAVDFVTTDEVLWTGLPDRQEAGSPNVLGAVALGAACRALETAGMEQLQGEEQRLMQAAKDRLAEVPGLRVYRLWDPDHDAIGVLTFNLCGYGDAELAAILSAEHGIGVRHGCFCAHPLMIRLLGVDEKAAEDIREHFRTGKGPRLLPGAVRASFGVGTTLDDIARLAEALNSIAENGPRWSYAKGPSGADIVPDPEPRGQPFLPIDVAGWVGSPQVVSMRVDGDTRRSVPASGPGSATT